MRVRQWLSNTGRRLFLSGGCAILLVCSAAPVSGASPLGGSSGIDPEYRTRLLGEGEVELVITALPEDCSGTLGDGPFRQHVECGVLVERPFQLGDRCATAAFKVWQVDDPASKSPYGSLGATSKIDITNPGLLAAGDSTRMTLVNVNGYVRATFTSRLFSPPRQTHRFDFHRQIIVSPPTHNYATTPPIGTMPTRFDYYTPFSLVIPRPTLGNPFELQVYVKGGTARAPLTYVVLQDGTICGKVGADHMITDYRDIRPWVEKP